MHRFVFLMMVAALLQAQGAGPRGAPGAAKPLRVALAKVAIAKGTLRAGFDVKGELPAEAFRGKVGGATLRFVDLDQDGKLAVGVDGMALDDAPFVVPIVAELLLHEGQFKVEFDATQQLTLTPVELGIPHDLVADASLLTELRVRAGLRPVALDPDACAACRKHCDYAIQNGLSDGGGGLAIHDEDPAKPGWTPDGARAGIASDLWPRPTNLREAIEVFYTTLWHRSPLVDPALTRVGVGLVVAKIAMVTFVDQAHGEVDYAHPPDGATGVPLAFDGNGEVPNPVPGTVDAVGCGFPILMRLSGKLGALESAELLDPKGKKVAGTFSSPERPANPAWPTNSNCAAFIPAKPLLPATTYRARFKFAATAEPVTWSFTTRR